MEIPKTLSIINNRNAKPTPGTFTPAISQPGVPCYIPKNCPRTRKHTRDMLTRKINTRTPYRARACLKRNASVKSRIGASSMYIYVFARVISFQRFCIDRRRKWGSEKSKPVFLDCCVFEKSVSKNVRDRCRNLKVYSSFRSSQECKDKDYKYL